MSAILEGIRILDLTVWQQGPYATMLLAELGADVVHIEGPSAPDPARGLVPPSANGLSHYMEALNRGKRAITLDLHDRRGRDALHRLVVAADVFVTNLRRPALDRFGASYETLSALNPRLIYAIANGNGPEGPHADHASMDMLGQARGGLMAAGAGDEGVPRGIPAGAADQVGAITLALAIMSALYHRERTGEGQLAATSLLGSQMAIQAFQITGVLFGGRGETPASRNPTWQTYRGGDGKWFALAMINDSFWPGVCRVIDRPDWLTDPRYATLDARRERHQDVIAEMSAIFATRPAAAWVDAFTAADLIAGPVNDYADIAADPQALANYIVEVQREGAGPVRVVGSPLHFEKTPARVDRLSPEFDQHTEEVLLEAGYDWPEIEALRRDGVIGTR